jgi:hypothetical protein
VNFCTLLTGFRKGIALVLSPRVFVPLAALLYVTFSVLALNRSIHDPKGRADLVSGDSMHYLDIATDFAKGNFSMDYVLRRPHRQPLYPAALAPVVHFVGKDFFWMGAVSIVFTTMGFVLLHAAMLSLWRSPAVAAIVGALYLTDRFLFTEVTRHFLTEPLHILLMVGIPFVTLAWFRERKTWQLPVAAALIGLDYLTRPNGLFVAISLALTLAVHESVRALRERNFSVTLRQCGLFAACALVFGVVTTPSWLPRLRDYGSPFHHGYLSNYLWVDTYREGHQGQAFAKYTWRDYAATHTLDDAADRVLHGTWNVCVAIPWSVNRKLHLHFVLALAGVCLALTRGRSEYRWLLLFGTIQLLPLIWTNLSNPTMRVPYAATLPFELFFAALPVAFAVSLLRRLPASIVFARDGLPRPGCEPALR